MFKGQDKHEVLLLHTLIDVNNLLLIAWRSYRYGIYI